MKFINEVQFKFYTRQARLSRNKNAKLLQAISGLRVGKALIFKSSEWTGSPKVDIGNRIRTSCPDRKLSIVRIPTSRGSCYGVQRVK